MTPLVSEQSEISTFLVRGKINWESAEMVVDSGFTRTLIHKRYVSDSAFTGGKLRVLRVCLCKSGRSILVESQI